jgi:hypothetical protein
MVNMHLTDPGLYIPTDNRRQLSLDMCMYACHARTTATFANYTTIFNVFAMRNGTECYCGTTESPRSVFKVANFSDRNDSACGLPCPGGPSTDEHEIKLGCGSFDHGYGHNRGHVAAYTARCTLEAKPIDALPDKHLQDQILAVTSSLSLLGSFFIIASWFVFKEIRFLSRKLIVYISLCDFMSSAAFLISTLSGDITQGGIGESLQGSPTTLCYVQGYLLDFFYLASFLWTGCFAYHLYQLICTSYDSKEQCLPYYHLISWGVPIAEVVYLFALQMSGEDSVGRSDRFWCWISNYDSEGAWRQFCLFYGPLIVVVIFNATVYIVLARTIRHKVGKTDGQTDRRTDRRTDRHGQTPTDTKIETCIYKSVRYAMITLSAARTQFFIKWPIIAYCAAPAIEFCFACSHLSTDTNTAVIWAS